MSYNQSPPRVKHWAGEGLHDGSPTPPNSGGKGGRMKDQELEIESMTKQIFNLKLRIFYLEEALRRERAGGAPDIGEMAEENLETKVLLEERTQEVEEKNRLLIKARNAIENLHKELEMARSKSDDGNSTVYRQMAQQLREKEAELIRLEARTNGLAATEKMRKDEIATLSGQVRELQTSLSKAVEESNTSRNLQQAMARDLQSKEKEIETLKANLRAVSEVTKGKQDIESLLQKSQAEVLRLNRVEGELMATLASKEEVIRRLTSRENDARREAEEAAAFEANEIARLNNKVQDLEFRNKQVIIDMRHVDDAKNSLNVELNKMQTIVNDLRKENSNLAQNLKSATEKCTELEKKLLAAETKVLVSESASREAMSKKDFEFAKLEVSLNKQWVKEESELKKELAHQKGHLAAVEYAKTAAEAKLLAVEETFKRKIDELENRLKMENDSKEVLFASSVSKAHFDSVISALRLEHQKEIDYIRNQKILEASVLKGSDDQKIVLERKLKESAIADAAAARRRAEEIETQYHEKLREWELMVVKQLGDWCIPDSSSSSSNDAVAKEHRPVGASLIGKLRNIRSIKAAFEEAVRRAESRQIDLVKRLQSHLDARGAELHQAETKIAELSENVSKLISLQEENRLNSTQVVATSQMALDEARRYYESRVEEMERNFKIADAEKSALEGQMSHTVEQYSELHDEISRLRRDLNNRKLEIRDLRVSRDEAVRRADRFAENNRILILQMEENKATVANFEQNQLNAKKEVEIMATNAELLRKTVSEQDNKLREYAQQLERYLEMLNKERGRKQELEETVLKQVEETKAMMRLTAGKLENSASAAESNSQKQDNSKKLAASTLVSERLKIALTLEQCQSRLEGISEELGKIVSKSQDSITKFERFIRDDAHPDTIIPLENDVYDLLERNGKLSQQLSRLSHDLDLFYKKFKKLELTFKNSSDNAVTSPVGRKSITTAPPPAEKSLASLHADFIKTLGKVGGDLQETASRLKNYHET